MSLAAIVKTNIVIARGAAAPQPLDVPILGVTLTAPQDALWGPALIREVDESSWQQTMTDVGIVDGDPIYEWLQLAFGQTVSPRLILLGKRATPLSQVVNFDLGAAGPATDGLYRITINGENYDHTASSETKAQVITALLATFPGGQAVTGSAGGSPEDMNVTADEAGASFTWAAAAPAPEAFAITVTQANVGLSTDLDAWEAERADWYLVTIVEAVSFDLANGFAQSLAAFARDITGWLRTDETTDPDAATALATRTAARLGALNYTRLVVPHIPTATDQDHAAIIGLKMPTTPGADTWAKAVDGVDGELWTTTQSNNLISGPYAYFDQIATLGASFAWTRNVRVVSGVPFDTIRGADYLKASVDAAVATALLGTPAPAYDATGFGEIGAAISSTLAAFVNSGFIATAYPDGSPGYTVTIPAVPPPGDPLRVARRTPPFEFTALIAGSIEIVIPIDGLLIQ
jgi:hypothetical protein